MNTSVCSGYRRLNLGKLKYRKHKILSTNEAIKDIAPIDWSYDVTSGKKKITITKENEG